MSDDNYSGLSTAPPFSYTGPVPAFFTRSRYRPSSTLSTETQFPESPSSTLPTSFDVSSPTLTQTDDPPSSTGTLEAPTPTSDVDPSAFLPLMLFHRQTRVQTARILRSTPRLRFSLQIHHPPQAPRTFLLLLLLMALPLLFTLHLIQIHGPRPTPLPIQH